MTDLADVLGQSGGTASPISRSAVVQASPAPNAATAWVKFVDSQPAIELPYVAGYIPVAGDVVNVQFVSGDASMQGMIMGAKATTAGNMVVNPNFYRAPLLVFPIANAPPFHWYRYVASGVAANFCQIMDTTAKRFIGNVAGAGGNQAGDTYIYTSPIPVKPGRSYYLTTSGHASVFVNTTLTVQSRLAFFSDAATDYPNFISETQFGSDLFPAASENDPYHFGTVTAPTGLTTASWARLVMRQSFTAGGVGGGGGNMMWSEVVMLAL